jgi:hypothetical protein
MKKKIKKKDNNDIIDKINDINSYQNNNIIEKTQKKEKGKSYINNNNKNNNSNSDSNTNKRIKSLKKQKSKEICNSPNDELAQKKPSKKQLSLETFHNIQIPLNNNDNNLKGNILQNSLDIKTCKTNKEKSFKEYSIQDEKINTNTNKNSKEINFKNQYLKTEIYPSYFKNKPKTKKGHYQCKLLNKKLLNNNYIVFDNILKSLQNQTNNIIKNKTPKKYSTKKNIPKKYNNNQSNSITRKRYSSHSPGLRKVSKDGISGFEKNINFPTQNNYPYPLVKHNNNIKNSYNILSDNIMKNFNSKLFFFNNNKENINKNRNNNKNFKPNKKFNTKKNTKINNKIYSIRKDNYFITNIKNYNKNNDETKLLRSSMNNALNINSFDYYLSSNISKKKHLMVEQKISNDIIKKNNNYHLLTNNFNIRKTAKNNVSKKTFIDSKGNNYLNNIFSDNSKPILINTSNIRNSTEIVKNSKIINSKSKNNNKTRRVSNKNSKTKSKNKKNNILSHKKNYIYNKNSIDNNIIINFNILKPNIILDHQRASSRKAKINRLSLNPNMTGIHNNNYISTKIERHMTEGNFISSVRNNFYNKSCKNKNNHYKNIDMRQIKKSKDIKQIIKSIQDMNKIQGNTNSINNKRRINTEI